MSHTKYAAARTAAGFTLVEVLAALAIVSVLLLGSAALVRQVALTFDRGTRSVTEGERLVLAVDRLAADFASARFVMRTVEGGRVAAFSAARAGSETPARVAFVAAGNVTSGPQGEELVSLTVERDGDLTRLVRRRAGWPGPRASFEEALPQDPVILFEGKVDIAFAFARLTPDGDLAWYDAWINEPTLPRYVRLIVRDRTTGADLLGEASFTVRANAPPACRRPDANLSCLAVAPLRSPQPARGAP
ncbi:MAG: prepilin-type N-terminal cleavage/methylation domain-containing protein [Hyphomicrobiaceae bacterium]|nr:prepilin-type N-terminal cleavage/methylation domain-containing protein [Hyphomicrobiaceae bacterium]